MSTALDALLAIQGTLLLHGSKDGAASVEPATSLGDLRGSKAVVYGECSASHVPTQAADRRRNTPSTFACPGLIEPQQPVYTGVPALDGSRRRSVCWSKLCSAYGLTDGYKSLVKMHRCRKKIRATPTLAYEPLSCCLVYLALRRPAAKTTNNVFTTAVPHW